MSNSLESQSACAGGENRRASRGRRSGARAFTLIELLVVISIIGVLASLVVGLSGVAGRKSKESRVKVELSRLINAVENYKSTMGFYPPDHQTNVAGVVFSVPSPN